jgi:hypothetical protein
VLAAGPPVPPGPSRGERLRLAGGRRSVQLVAAGVLGAIIGGVVVGAIGAATGDDHHQPRFAEYGRHGGPFMRGGPPNGWSRGGPGGPGGPGGYAPRFGSRMAPGQNGPAATPVPPQPAPASPAPSLTAPATP